MSASTGTNPNLPHTSAEQVDSIVRSALGAGDSGATQAIQNLTLVHQARNSQLKRAAAAATKQFGADNAETKAAEAAVTAGTARVASLTAVHLQAATPAPQVSTTGWVLHGRVFVAASTSTGVQQQPDANLTVFLVDGQKRYQAQFGFSYTDATGYFVLNHAGAKGEAPTDAQLFVEIADKKGQPVYLSTSNFQPVTGSATYFNIALPAKNKPLGDPPAALRPGAFPDLTKRT